MTNTREEELNNKSLDELTIEDIYDLEDMYSPLVAENQEELTSKKQSSISRSNLNKEELNDMLI